MPRQPRVMQLVALHNLSAKNLKRVASLGGLPMPSIAVLPAGNRFGAYGEITLVASLDLVDPSVEPAARLFEGDFYTARGPGEHAGDEGDMAAVLKRMREFEFFGERESASFPLGKLRSRFCKPLPDMSSAAAAAARIVSREDFDRATMAMNERVLDTALALFPHFAGLPGYTNFSRMCACEASMLRGLAQAVDGDRRTLISALDAQGFHGLPRGLLDRADRLSKAVARIPLPYFEAKIDRAVGLDEFVAAVIPSDSPAEATDILVAAGIGTILRYDDEARAQVVMEAAFEAYAAPGSKP